MGFLRLPIQVRIINYETHTICVDDNEVEVVKSLPVYGRQQATHIREYCGYHVKKQVA